MSQEGLRALRSMDMGADLYAARRGVARIAEGRGEGAKD